MPLGNLARAPANRGTVSRLQPLLLATLLSLSAPALAADQPSLKEVLGRAQTEAETKAVEDLVGKLKGVPRKTPAPTPSTETVSTPPGTSPAPSAPPVGTAATSTEPAATASTPPPAATTEGPSVASGTPGATETSPGSTVPPKEDRVASPSTPAPPPPPEVTTRPEDAVKSAEQRQIPSVDIEVFFAYKSAEITPEAVTALTTLGRALRDVRLVDDAFLIAGHTDAKGGAAYNLVLSQQRAEAVRQFLVANFGIDERKLVAKGFGLTHLKNPRRPLAGENRRVQIVNLSKDQPR